MYSVSLIFFFKHEVSSLIWFCFFVFFSSYAHRVLQVLTFHGQLLIYVIVRSLYMLLTISIEMLCEQHMAKQQNHMSCALGRCLCVFQCLIPLVLPKLVTNITFSSQCSLDPILICRLLFHFTSYTSKFLESFLFLIKIIMFPSLRVCW